jgi:hypothetical protein
MFLQDFLSETIDYHKNRGYSMSKEKNITNTEKGDLSDQFSRLYEKYAPRMIFGIAN